MLVIFIALIVGPIVAGKYLGGISIPMNLLQPTGLNHNDTNNLFTGTALVNFPGETAAATAAATATPTAR
ncbi:1,3-beta-D-glucan synthase, partial [Cryomyces antarcticus]